ncbi:MAG: hypothetical protein IJ188_04020 [Clostridia bacterium]|nr:hypothetical protein [Clostridia bacterium]
MKKLICAMLCLIMVWIATASFAAVSYTLPEKMQKQLDIGSGLKGSVTLHTAGNDPAILALQPFQDVELQFRGLRSGDEVHYYIYQAGENETQIGLTELYQTGEMVFLRSNMLPEEVFRLPAIIQLIDVLRQPEGGNPSFASALYRWTQLTGEEQGGLLDPVVAHLSADLELWVAQFANVSEVYLLENGTSALDLTYDIPMADLKKQIVQTMKTLLDSAEGQALLNKVLNEEQRQIYANQNLDYFYEEALSALDNNYDLQYTRTVSTLGDTLSSTLELPLDEKQMQFQSLLIEEKGGLSYYTLRSEEQMITLILGSGIDWKEISSISAWILIRPNPNSDDLDNPEYHAYRLDGSHRVIISSDEEARDHQRSEWKLNLERDVSRLPDGEDAALYPEEEPMSLDVQLHYFSKYSQSSPTTLEFDITFHKKDFDLNAQGQMKTASPWVFTPFSTEGAVDMISLSADELNLKLAEFLAASGEQLIPAEIPEAPTSEETQGSEDAAAQTQDEAVEEPVEELEEAVEEEKETASEEEEVTEETAEDASPAVEITMEEVEMEEVDEEMEAEETATEETASPNATEAPSVQVIVTTTRSN